MKKGLLFLWLLPVVAAAQLQVAKIFSDNMVLQRDQPLRIWGKAWAFEKVTVVFGGKTATAVAAADSSWRISFPKQNASAQSQSISITSGNEKLELKNILIGDIWICSGQSNMEWPMQKEAHFNDEKKNMNQPLIRFANPPPAGRYVYGVAYTDSLNKRLNATDFYLWNGWQQCDSNSVKDMSAVAYYFAKSIVAEENIPVGLINLSIGGAPIETFISREAMQNSKQFAAKVQGNWLENEALPQWIRQRGTENVGSNPDGYKDDLGPNHAYKPGFAFEAGMKPLLSLPVKGVIWYQGESNSLEPARVAEYGALQKLLVDDYRAGWKNPNLPFYWVQLSSIDTANYQSQYWPQFRDEQRKLLNEVTNGGMVVTSDIGFKNNVHPTNKRDVGERLARWALNKTYGKNIVPSGPLPARVRYENGSVILSFQYANGLQTADGQALRGFSFDAKTDAGAVIQNNTVVIATNKKPAVVYYGWKPFTDANLVNGERLPASTFKLNVQ